MRNSFSSYPNAVQGNDAGFKMTDGAASPAYTTPGTVLSDTLYLSRVPVAIASKVTGVLRFMSMDGGIASVSLVAGALPMPIQAKRCYATGTATLTAADLTLFFNS